MYSYCNNFKQYTFQSKNLKVENFLKQYFIHCHFAYSSTDLKFHHYLSFTAGRIQHYSPFWATFISLRLITFSSYISPTNIIHFPHELPLHHFTHSLGLIFPRIVLSLNQFSNLSLFLDSNSKPTVHRVN